MRWSRHWFAGGRLAAAALIAAVAMLSVSTLDARPAEAAGPTTLGATPWQVYVDDNIYVNLGSTSVHGEPSQFDGAPAIPASGSASWANCGPGAPTRTSPYSGLFSMCPNPTTIGLGGGSILGGCWANLNFTYFQSLVSIPTGTTISTFSVNMSGADDGAQIVLFNSTYPGGVVPTGGNIYQGTPQSTANLAPYVVAGEVNRVVIQQVDDCAVGNNLNTAQILLNGSVVLPPECVPGTYSATGREPCTPAPAGTFVATTGATAPTPCPPGTSSLAGATSCTALQTLSIIGGSGTAGTPDASTDWSQDPVAWDAGISTTGAWHFTGDPSPVWRAAYLVGAHPWGFVPGTNSWINCGPTNASAECGNAAGTVVAFRVRFSLPAGSVNPNITFWINSDNAGTYYINGTQVTDRLVGGPGTGGNPVPASAPGIPGVRTAALQSALQPGQNEMFVVVEDWGGAAGFNYRADLTVLASEPPVIIPPTPADTTPPVITPTVTGTLGTNGWYTSVVNVSWTVTDTGSPVSSTTGCDATAVSADTAGVTFTCTATSGGGTASESVTVKRDATAPAATATAAPAPNGGGWNNTDVTVTFTGTDGLSGIASCSAAAVLGEGAGQSASGTCTDNAGNVSAPATASNINVDKTAPAVTVTGVADGASYIVGGVPAAGCTTVDALSGVATPATATSAGGPLGTVTATCAGATDVAGNAAAAVTATYTVTYTVCTADRHDDDDDDDGDDDHGDHRDGDRGHKSGSTIPVKVRFCDANGQNVGSRSLPVTAVGLSPAGSLNDSGHANPGNRFRFDDGKYIFNLSTKGLAPGDYTLDFTIGNDPTLYGYSFTIRAEEKHGKGDDRDDHGKGDRNDKDGKDKDGKKDDGKGGKKDR